MGSTLLTAAILIGITFLFIFLFSFLHKRRKKREKEKRESQMKALIDKHHLNIDEKEELPHALVGIDKTNSKLVYINHYNAEGAVDVIDLSEIRSAKMDIVEQPLYEDRNGKSVVVERQVLLVQLVLASKNDTGYNLPFYQVMQDSLGELETLKTSAQHWENIVNQYIQQGRMDKMKKAS